ncbi:D-glycero-beta-D-manno-heptose-7-phosphate kinase [Gaopeijia maritima]|uniref:D-glycero-beta-D-manno-heptose-7-phosphate kinase n=1 Tax=Gaopeijia maritima TaxID=3119007 RepID=A0ABU9EB13_9BACT
MTPDIRRLTPERAGEVLAAIAGVRALVIGDLMLDEYLQGSVDRISPEAPVPVVHVDREWWALGGAANVAANVAALGASCEVVGVVGDDAGGQRLTDALASLGARTSGVVAAPGRPTTVKTRVMARSQQVVRYDREEARDVRPEVEAALIEAIRREAAGCQVLILEDYNKGVLTSAVIRAVLQVGHEMDIPTVVDPKRLRFFEYGGVTLFKPNAKELADALGEHLDPDDPEWMERTRVRLDCRTLLLTLGERGVALVSEGGRFLRIPAVARAVYDVSGAGDTVVAVAAVALAAGADEFEAAILANHAAALEVQKAGVATVSPDEILTQTRTFLSRGDS